MPQKRNQEEHNKEMAIATYTIKLDARKSPMRVVPCLPVQLLIVDCTGDSILKYHLKCAEKYSIMAVHISNSFLNYCHLYGYCYPEEKMKKHLKGFLAIWAQI